MITPKIFNRAMMAVWLVFLPIAELGATGSYARMAGTFVVLAVMAWFGWMERDNTMREAIDEAFEKARQNKKNNEKCDDDRAVATGARGGRT